MMTACRVFVALNQASFALLPKPPLISSRKNVTLLSARRSFAAG